MAKKRRRKTIPPQISPFVWGYLVMLKKKVPIERAYLFGSWATGKQHKWSDIDIAVVSPKFTDWFKKTRLLTRPIGSDFADVEPHGFHPRDFKPEESPVVEEILKHGVRII